MYIFDAYNFGKTKKKLEMPIKDVVIIDVDKRIFKL